MSSATGKRERAEAMLGELAELGLMLARDLAVQARAAEDVDEKVALAAAFQKTSRAVRLTLALDFQLERQAARADREAELQSREDLAVEDRAAREAAWASERAARPAELSPSQRQKARVRGVLNRLLWAEAEGDQEEFDILVEDLNARLDEAAQAEGFADLPIEALAQRLKSDMQIEGRLVVTTARSLAAANTPAPPLSDTGSMSLPPLRSGEGGEPHPRRRNAPQSLEGGSWQQARAAGAHNWTTTKTPGTPRSHHLGGGLLGVLGVLGGWFIWRAQRRGLRAPCAPPQRQA
jgi:hypothetical protein